MNLLIKKLAETFNLDEAEVLEKFDLDETATTNDWKNALGVNALFLDKPELEKYIQNKVRNKIVEVEKLKKELETKNQTLTDFEKVNKDWETKFSKINARIKEKFESEWTNSKLPKTNFEDVNYEDLDFTNLKSEVFRIAKLKNISTEIVEPKKIESIENTNTNLNGTQSFEVGARRIK
ncbi:hypothetical protein [Metamycoplasma hyosynoviae]|uniref:Uncharacterized protein n=1 Tax=Metamycoplasma hyosynoviae TaxID=29559 RepID=A0A063YHK9_9BACT|nr:hypothetical protein [Metamycoplasma hyosynoviae]KDE41903.1 hypothetical protein NPL3_02860 [Metamycoplasma hyosynoviae]KDE43306.1 hypothetical protein NPL5_02575 [Metamycoplasma hyosynoviae]KDE44202.1 hypothetical protein NPL2_03540 [Metamycoplasma hyosynoviae]KDE44990.1 hypothetical protein NPL2_01830 [Metamycoplasma hyosynoviae]KDE45214.1 hypothetical protein NPL4_02060 [Metamycoplasma hyosynoviae]